MEFPQKRSVRWPLALILSFLAISILSRIFYNGQVLGLDYSLYYPDGVCYTSHAYEFAGLSPQEAWNRTVSEYQSQELPTATTLAEMRPQSCQSVQARIVYPLLSAPFVAQFGLPGMLVVPVVAVILSFLLIFFAMRRLNLNNVSVIVSLFALASSSSLMRWNLANLPENLLLLWASISVFLLVRLTATDEKKKTMVFTLITLVVLIIISSLTKRSAHFWTIVFFSFSLAYAVSPTLRQKIRWQVLTASTSFLIAFTWIVDRFVGRIFGGQNSLWIATTATSCAKGDNVSANPGNVATPLSCDNLVEGTALNIGQFFVNEIGQLAVLDKPLFLICGTLIIGVLTLWKTVGDVARICLLVSVLTFGATMLNATLGLNFRLMTPALPYLAIGAVIVIDNVIKKACARS